MESLTIVCAVLSITINLYCLKDSVWMGHFANRTEKLHFLPPWSIWRLIHHPLFAAAKRRQSRFCRTSDLFIVTFQSILIHSFPLLSIPISNLNFHLFIFKLQTNHRISKDWTGALFFKEYCGGGKTTTNGMFHQEPKMVEVVNWSDKSWNICWAQNQVFAVSPTPLLLWHPEKVQFFLFLFSFW